MKWYLKALYQYFDFSGRSRRKEFWVFILSNAFIVLILTELDILLNTTHYTIISYIFSSLVLIPSLTVFLRRLHDTGKSGWNILLIFIPIIGWLWLLILLILVGEPKMNNWGPYPKGIDNN